MSLATGCRELRMGMGSYTAGDMRYAESDGADSVKRKRTQGPVYRRDTPAPCQFDVITIPVSLPPSLPFILTLSAHITLPPLLIHRGLDQVIKQVRTRTLTHTHGRKKAYRQSIPLPPAPLNPAFLCLRELSLHLPIPLS